MVIKVYEVWKIKQLVKSQINLILKAYKEVSSRTGLFIKIEF